MCQEPLSAPTHTRNSERGASDFRTGFAPVGPFVHLSSLPSIQEMVPNTVISSPLFLSIRNQTKFIVGSFEVGDDFMGDDVGYAL